MLSPSLPLGAISSYGGIDHYSILKLILSHWTFTSFFRSGTTPLLHQLTSEPPIRLPSGALGPLPVLQHSIQLLRLFSFSRNLHFWQCHLCTPIPDTPGCPHDKSSHRHTGCIG